MFLAMKRFLDFFFSQLAIVQLLAAKEARVLVPPVAVNISLNDEAIFTCTAVANHINWRANSTPVNDIMDKGFFSNMLPVPINETANIYSSQLRVVGSDFSNATMIVCRVSLLAMNVYTVATSEPVLLLVQGLLNAVTDLHTEILNSTTLFISWNPPHTLLGVPILFYRVKNNSFNITVVNATTVYYPIQPSQSRMEVTIVPVNKVGDGIARTLSTNITFITTTLVDEAHSDLISPLVQLQTTSTIATTTGPVKNLSLATKILITSKQSSTPRSAMKPKGTIMIMNLYLWITVAAATFLLIIVTVTVVIICATCIIWRKKTVKFNLNNEVFMMTQENPAYATVKAMSNDIVTQKNRAYEDVTKIRKNTS